MKSLPAVKTPQWPAAEFPPLFNPKWLVAAFILKIPNQISSASLQSNKEISSTDSFLSNQAIHRRFQPSRSENKNVPKTRFKQIFMNFAVNDADNRHSRRLLKEISLWSLLYFCSLSPPITPQVLYDTFPVVCRRNVPIIKLQHLWRNTFHGPWRPHELHSLSLLFPASIHLALQCGGFWPWWTRDEDMCKIKRFILVYLSGLFGLQGRSRQHSRTRDESRGKFAGESPEETEQSGATVRWRAGSCSAADDCDEAQVQREATPPSTCTVKEQVRGTNKADTPARIQSFQWVRIFVIYEWEIFSPAVCWMQVITGVSLSQWIHK